MKILHYVDENRLSWVVPWLQLLESQQGAGDENVVVCRPGGTLGSRLAERGFTVIAYKPRFSSFPRLCSGFKNILQRVAPDLIHTRLSSAAAIGGFWGKEAGISVVSTVDKFPKPRYYRKSDLLLACSSAVSRHMEAGGISPEKIRVVPNSVDVGFYRPCRETRDNLRREMGVGEEKKIILSAGRLVDWKGFDVLIRAFALAKLSNAVLWIFGSGPEEGRLAGMVRDLGLSSSVLIHSFVPELRPFFWASDLFVLPSKKPEPFGLVLLEAMAAGLPVIGTDAGGPRDIVEEGISGWLVKPGDIESMARRMEETMQEDEKRDLLGKGAIERSRRFDISRGSRETREQYLSLLGKVGNNFDG